MSANIKDDYLARVLAGEEFLLFDGAMGTMLQQGGLKPGELPDLLCLSDPALVTSVHRAYVEAGSQVVTTNTFGANRLKLEGKAEVAEVFAAAVACAREAGARYVAADMGPTGELMDPYGDLEYEEAYEIYAEQARAAEAAGAYIVIVETMADLTEAEAAVRAAVDSTSLPVFATMTFGEHGRTLMGTAPAEAASELEGFGASAVGANGSQGPIEMAPIIAEMLEATSKPVIVQANAGLPTLVDGVTGYSIDAGEYIEAVGKIVEAGASVVGGCCGTNPEYIMRLAQLLADRVPAKR